MKKYENFKIILERMNNNFFKQVGELEKKPKISLMVIKNQNLDKRTETDEVFKIWK